jgi:small multidrug resistance family-3 protein
MDNIPNENDTIGRIVTSTPLSSSSSSRKVAMEGVGREEQSGSVESTTTDEFQWTASTIIFSIVLFLLAGVAEIIGGWMVWMAVRGNNNNSNTNNPQVNTESSNKKPWWFAILGSVILVAYGFIPTLQPADSFGRIYAVYGGFFIVLSFLFGWWLDGDKPDRGDIIGGLISLVGVCLILFWPRS